LDGKVLWSKQLGQMQTLAGFGEGSSPALHGDTVAVQWDEEGPSFVAAYDVRSGEERWKRARAGGVAHVTNAYMGDVIQALRLTGAKGALEAGPGLLWARKGTGSYVPTPVVHGGRMHFLRESSGVLACLDAATGATIYQGQRRADVRTVHASPVLVASEGKGRLYCPARDGTTVVVKAGDTFEVLSTNRLDDVFDASPVVVARELYLRGRSHLYCIAEPE
jgi:outer membrane protein assembly factor BamB